MSSLGLVLAVSGLGITLGAPDESLERTASINWPARRTGHLLAVFAVVALLPLLAQATGTRFEPISLVLRDLAGLIGITALGAALFGAAASWVLPLIWTLVAMMPLMGAVRPVALQQILTWPIQLGEVRPVAIAVAVMTMAGVVLYGRRGCPATVMPES